MEAMDGAARCLEALRLQQKICNCRPLEFNIRLLEVATAIGAKVRNTPLLDSRFFYSSIDVFKHQLLGIIKFCLILLELIVCTAEAE